MADRILNAGIFLLTAALVILDFRKDGKWNPQQGRYALCFFTVQSNILCAVSALLLCLFPESGFAWHLKYIGTAAVTVTMLTVFLFLAPSLGSLSKLLRDGELYMHLITPLLALITFCVFEKRGMSFGTALTGLLSICLYGPWYLYKIRFAPEGKRWEDFYGFNKGGKWPVSFACMLAGTFLICMGLMALQNL